MSKILRNVLSVVKEGSNYLQKWTWEDKWRKLCHSVISAEASNDAKVVSFYEGSWDGLEQETQGIRGFM